MAINCRIMTDNHIRFAAKPLRAMFAITAIACVVFTGAAFGLAEGTLRGSGLLRLIGPVAVWYFFVFAALVMAWSAIGALRRLAGDRVVAAIRDDGIELRGMVLSRFIPWRCLDRLYLRDYLIRDNLYRYIHAESRCPPDGNRLHHFLASRSHGIATQALDATEAEVERWVAAALLARDGALAGAREIPVATRLMPGRPGFGRRLV